MQRASHAPQRGRAVHFGDVETGGPTGLDAACWGRQVHRRPIINRWVLSQQTPHHPACN